MKKIIASLIILVLPALVAAESYNSISALLRHTPIKYENSLKESVVSRGLYFYWGHGLNHSFEGAFDHTWLKYRSEAELKQDDFTFVYTNYHYYPYKFLLGAHKISDNMDGEVLTLFGGINNYIIGKQELQLNFYYSRYRNDGDPYLSAYQITPEYGTVLLRGSQSSLYAKIKGHYIHLKEDDETDLEEKDFYSAELSLSYYYKNLRVTAFGWAGEQAFAVREGGFSVYNLPEKHTGGYGIKAGVSIYRTTHIYLTYAKDKFKEMREIAIPFSRKTTPPSSTSQEETDSTATIVSFSIIHTF